MAKGGAEPISEAASPRPRLFLRVPGALEIKTDGRDSGRATDLLSASPGSELMGTRADSRAVVYCEFGSGNRCSPNSTAARSFPLTNR